jgi:hypothetical protein
MSKYNETTLNGLGDECLLELNTQSQQFQQSINELCKMTISPTLWKYVENHYNKIIMFGIMFGKSRYKIPGGIHTGDKPFIVKYLYNYLTWSLEINKLDIQM